MAQPGRLLDPSFQVLGEVLVHLEHGHPVLAEHRPELVVGHDLALVLRVLELVLLDVIPNAPSMKFDNDHPEGPDELPLQCWRLCSA